MGSWSFLSDHGRLLLFLRTDPGVQLHEIATRLGVTERSAHGIVTDLIAAGHISRHEDGRRDRYQIVAHQSLPEPITREETFLEVLALLPGAGAGRPPAESRPG
jgi:predicted ArsR family transcriptional regulator